MDVKSEISINRITDNHLITEFVYNILINKKYADVVNFTSVSLQVLGAKFEISFSDVNTETGKIERLSFLEGRNTESINEITLRVEDGLFSISYIRNATDFIDKVVVKVRPYNMNSGKSQYELSESDAVVLSEINNDLIRYTSPTDHEGVNHNFVLSRLEGISADLISKQHEHLRKIEEDKQKYFEETQNILLHKLKELEQKHSQKDAHLESEYEEKNIQLTKREQRIIDEDNTTARRETTRGLLQSVIKRAERFSFSSGVNARGYLIFLLCVVLGAFGIYHAYEASTYLASLPRTGTDGTAIKYIFGVNDWFNVGKVITGSIIFITSILYLMKWMNQWANKIADIELDYQKFSRDLNRADLTIEMCLEWSDKKDGEIPNVLLSSLTSGIFIDTEHKPVGDINHPVEQLAAALLKSAEKIELPLGGGKITTNGKALSKV